MLWQYFVGAIVFCSSVVVLYLLLVLAVRIYTLVKLLVSDIF